MARLFSALTLLALSLAVVALLLLQPPAPRPPLPALSGPVDLILVEKAARRLTLIQDGQPVRTYRIALGFSPTGDKTRRAMAAPPKAASSSTGAMTVRPITCPSA